MSSSEYGPHQGEIRLPNGKRVAITKRNGFWYGGKESAWTRRGLEDKLRAKAKQTAKPKPWWWL
jgi:hypothetical protein